MDNPNQLFSVEGKVIIITGGAGFLGQWYGRALTAAGAHVISWDKGGDEPIDITNESEVQRALTRILEQHGRIDVLINNAAMNPAADSPDKQNLFLPYEKYPVDLWRRELEVNLTGMMIVTKAVAPTMMAQKSGSIINIASDVSVIAHDHRVYNDPANERFKSIAYTTTKSGILGFTRQWAARLGAYNVRCNAFSPTGAHVPTDSLPEDFIARYGGQNMFGRMAHPDEYIGPIMFLCSDASAFMTGQNLIVDGGKTAW